MYPDRGPRPQETLSHKARTGRRKQEKEERRGERRGGERGNSEPLKYSTVYLIKCTNRFLDAYLKHSKVVAM